MPRRAVILTHSYYLRDTRPRRHANALVEDGWEVDVVCARDEGEPARATVDGVRILRLPARRKRGSKFRYVFEYMSFGAMAFAALAALHARRRYDLVYVFSIPNILVRAAAVPRLARARVVLDVRDPMPEFFSSRYHLADDHRLVRALVAEERIACRYADHVVTVHEGMRDLLLRTGVKPEGITVVMNAPDPRIFDDAGTGERDPADRTLLYAGTVATRYGVDVIIRAVAALRDSVPGIRARIVGDGDAVPMLRNLAAELGVADRVEFTGPVTLDRLPAIIRSAWLGTQPHRADPLMRLCFSTKILEWARLGLPVIVARTDAFTRTFSGDELTFVAPGDVEDLVRAVRAAASDPEGLTARAARARAAVQRLDWTSEKQKLLAVANGGRSVPR